IALIPGLAVRSKWTGDRRSLDPRAARRSRAEIAKAGRGSGADAGTRVDGAGSGAERADRAGGGRTGHRRERRDEARRAEGAEVAERPRALWLRGRSGRRARALRAARVEARGVSWQ